MPRQGQGTGVLDHSAGEKLVNGFVDQFRLAPHDGPESGVRDTGLSGDGVVDSGLE